MGEVFAGRYELIDPLGEGGMGTVWRAWDRRDQQYLAAKVLRQTESTSLLRFMREQSFRIHHPHVVVPLGWAGEDDRVLFTMPLMGGGSAATLVGDYGGLPPAWVALLLDQLLDALDAVHTAGLVHRDVKPANLLLEPTGTGRPHLRLSDFGIASPLNEPRLTRTDLVIGTPGYLAPEAARGADPDRRQDLYAAGMTALEMLSGTRPKGDAPPPTAPAGAIPLVNVIRRLIDPSPENRPATAADARRELAATGMVAPDSVVPDDLGMAIEVFDQVPPVPAPGEPTDPTEPTTKRRWPALVLPLASVAAGVALVGVAVARLV